MRQWGLCSQLTRTHMLHHYTAMHFTTSIGMRHTATLHQRHHEETMFDTSTHHISPRFTSHITFVEPHGPSPSPSNQHPTPSQSITFDLRPSGGEMCFLTEHDPKPPVVPSFRFGGTGGPGARRVQYLLRKYDWRCRVNLLFRMWLPSQAATRCRASRHQ